MSAEVRLSKKVTEGIGKALIDGVTWRDIRTQFQVSNRQILKARETLSAKGWDVRKDLAQKLEGVVSMGWERLLERMDDDKLDDKTLSILTGIATDKYFAAMNIPTQRVQVIREDTTAIRDAIRDAIREAKPVSALPSTTGSVETEPALVIA